MGVLSSSPGTEAMHSAAVAEPYQKSLRILVADDEPTNCLMLSAMLSRDGYTVFTAEDGQEALHVFDREQPDMVLMDVMMPGMDGYEATRRIKEHAGQRFVPVIFLTALQDTEALVRCVTSGGDDFLTKPHNLPILRAKIAALERVRQLYATLKAQKDELASHHAQIQQEQHVAEGVFRNIVHAGCLDAPHIKHLLSPMAIFNGDLLLAAPKPAGGMHVMLGDFTGHGLPAALGAIPASDIFYEMTANGYAIVDIVAAINHKLKVTMPTGVFCAACLLAFNMDYSSLTVWNGGIPDLLLHRNPGESPQRMVSKHLPLGVVDNDRLDRRVDFVDLKPGDRVYAYTDGVIEARDPEGESFGQQHLEAFFVQNQDPDALFDEIHNDLTAFRAGRSQSDDITLIEITCDTTLANSGYRYTTVQQQAALPTHWQMTLELGVDALRRVDPLPQLMHMMTEIQGLHEHRERLFTVLAELFSNALEHGVLGLESTLKDSPQGFADYYVAREKRLADLTQGWIKIAIDHTPLATGGKLIMQIEDSGPGFDYHRVQKDLMHQTAYSGRGILLVTSFCQELIYHGSGNCAQAVYVWS